MFGNARRVADVDPALVAAWPGASGRVAGAGGRRPGGREGRRNRANENAPPRKILQIFYKLATNGLTDIGSLGMTKQVGYTATYDVQEPSIHCS